MLWCIRESWAYLRNWFSTACSPIPFGYQNRLGDIEYLCQNMRHRLTYSWQSRNFSWNIIEVLAHLWSASQRVRSWDTSWVFLAQMPVLLPGFSWPMIKDHSQLQSSILSRMSFLDMYEANFDKLRVIIVVLIPAQTRLKIDKYPTEVHVLGVRSAFCIFKFAPFSLCFLRLWISGPSAHRSIKTLHL